MPPFAPKSMIQNGRVALDPAPDGDKIHSQPALRHHFLEVAVAERVPQKTTEHTTMMIAFWKCRPRNRAGLVCLTKSTYQNLALRLQQNPK